MKVQTFYICPFCFYVNEDNSSHEHPMLFVNSGQPGDERRKPINDRHGTIVSRAPLWYVEACW